MPGTAGETFDLRRVARRYRVFVCPLGEARFAALPVIGHVHVDDGIVSIDGVPIGGAQISARAIDWSHHAEGRSSAGHLTFSRSGIDAHGMLSLSAGAGEPVLYAIHASAVPATPYRTRITTQRHPAGTDPDEVPADGWRAGADLALKNEFPPDRELPVPSVALGGRTLSLAETVLDAGADDVLRIGLQVDPVICDMVDDAYLTGAIAFSAFGDSFTGTIDTTCRSDSRDGAFLWTGIAAPSTTVSTSTAQSHAVAQVDLPYAILGATTLSLVELVGLVPGPEVHDRAFRLLIENMQWAIGQSPATAGWLRDFFAKIPPVLEASRIAAIQPDLAWYQSEFAIAYLVRGFDALTGPGAPSRHLDTVQAGKLDAYFTAGLARSSAYNRQIGALYLAAYRSTRPRLSAYMADGATKWADAVLAYATRLDQLGSVAIQASRDRDVRAANNVAALLHVLDPTDQYARRYTQRLLCYTLLRTALGTVVNDPELTMSWLPEALRRFGGQGATGERQHIATALGAAAQALGGYEALARQIATMLIASGKDNCVGQAIAAQAAFATRYPEHADAGRALLVACWAGGVYGVASVFVNANVNTGATNLAAIGDGVALIGVAADRIPALLAGPLAPPDWNALLLWCAEANTLDSFGRMAQNLVPESAPNAAPADGSWLAAGVRGLHATLQATPGAIDFSATRWTKILRDVSPFFGGVAVIAALGITVANTADFVKDIEDGKPVSEQAIDGTVMSANFLAITCGVLAASLGSTLFGAASAVFALLGLAMAVVQALLPRSAPPSPVDVFMRDIGVPFVEGLKVDALKVE